ncbi:MAG: hypothetical protein QNJ60_17475 [Xenococcaceae cyanobacterium MO_188.B19]|nr:hypothetical protein [Xenococcaceae cyanobacterium MO_188.B19]
MITNITQLQSAKRTKVERESLHAWHPYYAGYSENFVRSAINYLRLSKYDLVLDPWSGSGITNYICESYIISSIGLDINPIISYFGQAKSGLVLYLLNRNRVKLQEQILTISNNLKQDFSYDISLDNFVSSSLANNLIVIAKAIVLCNFPKTTINNSIIKILENTSIEHPLKAFFLCALFQTARKLSGYKSGSNPTWFKKIEHKQSFSLEEVQNVFIATSEQMYNTLQSSKILSKEYLLHINYTADAKQMSFKDNSFDAIITSPPYLTRIDYAMTTQLEILLLKDSGYLRELRVKTMGAPVIRNSQPSIKKSWGKICNDILNQIENHYSKGSKTYYWKNIVQYFDDAWQILNEIYRVLKKGKSALIVVQSSYYKDIEIPLDCIYIEMENNIGFFETKIPFTEIIKSHMAHVNILSSSYKQNKIYYESCIELIK